MLSLIFIYASQPTALMLAPRVSHTCRDDIYLFSPPPASSPRISALPLLLLNFADAAPRFIRYRRFFLSLAITATFFQGGRRYMFSRDDSGILSFYYCFALLTARNIACRLRCCADDELFYLCRAATRKQEMPRHAFRARRDAWRIIDDYWAASADTTRRLLRREYMLTSRWGRHELMPAPRTR